MVNELNQRHLQDRENPLAKGMSAFEKGEFVDALNWLLIIAEENAQAQARVGLIFFLGLTSDRDLEKAVFWLEKASKNGQGDAAHNLSTLYSICEPEMPRNVSKSKFWLSKAIELGFKVAPDEWYDSVLQ